MRNNRSYRERETFLVVMLLLVLLVGGAFGIYATYEYITTGDIPSPPARNTRVAYYLDRVVIYINETQGTLYSNTKSMDPTLDAGMEGVLMKVECPNNLFVGDIISYKHSGYYISHRVVKMGYDSVGWWAYTKGDTNTFRDTWKIRCDDVVGVTMAVIY